MNFDPMKPFQHSSRWARLGEPIGLVLDMAGTNQRLCEYRSAAQEPRPTNHLSLLTSHFSPLGYVCF
jgi:hypothetical protein